MASARAGKTLEEVGQELGVTRERVRQIEMNALAKARILLHRWGIESDDLLEVDNKPPG